MKIAKYSIGLWLAALLLHGCGGGGGSDGGGSSFLTFDGLTTQATLSADNVDELSVTSASAAKQVVSTELIPVAFKGSVDKDGLIQDMAVLIGQAGRQSLATAAAKQVAARTENLSGILCDGGGTAIATYPDSSTETNFEFEVVFTSCTLLTVDGSAVFNGSMSGRYVEDASSLTLAMAWENLTITLISGTQLVSSEALNGSMTCTATDTVNLTDLTCFSDFVGIDGRVYRITNVSVGGDSFSGYTVSARVYDPDHGYITINTVIPLTFNCPDGKPDTGRILFAGASGDTATVEFNACSGFTLTYNGVPDILNW